MKKTVRDISVDGKRVLVRVDFNVPLDKNGGIADDTRIRACLPTIRHLIEHHSRVILCSHLGRPGGKIVAALSLAPAAARLSDLLGQPVQLLHNCVGPETETAIAAMSDGVVVLLENLRFNPGEEADDPVFALALSQLADCYVNDAFGACHRQHASIVGVPRHLPAAAGLLLEKELSVFENLLEDPARPFGAVIGGAKLRGKLGVLKNIILKVDTLLLGGGMAATFFLSRGYCTGTSPVEEDLLQEVRDLTERAATRGVRLVLPRDVVITDGSAGVRVGPADKIPAGWAIADIGPDAREEFSDELRRCRTIVWNGPVGIFETPQFAAGTRAIAGVLAGLDAFTVAGGGSTAEAVTVLGLAGKISFVSTGGGAMLRFLAGETLPGVAALPDV